MKIVKETTEWKDGTPNHTYALEKDRLIGYKSISGLMQKFKKPMMFDKKYRTFKVIDDSEFEAFMNSN